MMFGYAYPAYECYKTVEMNRPEIEQLRFWCQYWILVALLTVCERVGDAFVSWIPMYSEAKLAFFIYLWYPKTKGTTYVYDSFFRPYVAKHENDIDRNLLELKTRAGDMAVLYFQRAASYGQTRVFDILQYVATQSTPRPRTTQPQAQGTRGHQANGPATRQAPPPPPPPEPEQPPSPTSSTSSSQVEEVAPTQVTKPPTKSVPKSPARPSILQKANSTPSGSTSSQPIAIDVDETSTDSVPTSSANENPPKETVMDEVIRVTRGRLRKTRSSTAAAAAKP
ncbi:hypothetical protein ACFE04_013734 [Oxalis oulophora]